MNRVSIGVVQSVPDSLRSPANIVVDADLLELVTKALYVDPLTIYREYIQNSADAIEEAVRLGILANSEQGRIDVRIDPIDRVIKVRDNGVGIGPAEFESCLTSLGRSKKKGKGFRGFRGIGRLGGLAYARKLTFRTRSSPNEPISEMIWDGELLKQFQSQEGTSIEVQDLIAEVVSFRMVEDNALPERFFEVELNGVSRFGNDVLLNSTEVKSYIEQVAPLPINPEFKYKNELEEFMGIWGLEHNFRVFLNDSDEHLVRPFNDSISLTGGLSDRIESVEFFEIPGDEGIDAVGWLFEHSYLGAIPKSEPVGGLRARMGNLQIGDRDLFAEYFPEKRFNSWCIGEIHVLSNQLKPNSRRDDFERNVWHQNLVSHVIVIGRKIAANCRRKSALRNSLKNVERSIQSVRNVLELYEKGLVTKTIARNAISKRLSSLDQSISRLDSRHRKDCDAARRLLDEEIETRLSATPQKAPIRKLPKAQKEIFEKAVHVLHEECPTPEIASRVIERLLLAI